MIEMTNEMEQVLTGDEEEYEEEYTEMTEDDVIIQSTIAR